MLPILSEDVGEIAGAGVIPSLIVFQNYVDEKGKTKIKRRVTHDCSRKVPPQNSINSRCVEAEMEPTIFAFFLRILLQIH